MAWPGFRYLYFILLAALFIAGLTHVARHFIDYPVYEMAGRKLLEGRPLALYDFPGGSVEGFYYAYFFALCFVPFAALGVAGKYLFFLLFFGLYIKLLNFSIPLKTPYRWFRLSALVLLTTYAMNDAFMNANIGIILLAMGVFAYELREKKPRLAGLVLGAAIVFKTYPVIILGHFIWEKRWKVVASSVLWSAFFLFLVPILLHGPSTGMEITRSYFQMLGQFNTLWNARGWHYGLHVFQNIHGTAIRYGSLVGIGAEAVYRISVPVSCALVIFVYLKSFLSRQVPTELKQRMFLFTLAVVPMIMPISWYNMALFYAPLIGYLFVRKDQASKIALIVYTLLYCLTTPDIVGRPLNQKLCFYAIPWFSLLGLVGVYLWQMVREFPRQFYFGRAR